MQPDRCLHFCLLGESGIGQSAFLQCYKHALNLATGASKAATALNVSSISDVSLRQRTSPSIPNPSMNYPTWRVWQSPQQRQQSQSAVLGACR